MIINPGGGYLCLQTPLILGASSQSSAMSMQPCQPGQQNQMYYTQVFMSFSFVRLAR
jgi:hypothetical protein